MAIWPVVTPEKAALFNKYGKGIIHMGLHLGVTRPRRVRAKHHELLAPPEVIDLVPLLTAVSELEETIKEKLSGPSMQWRTGLERIVTLTYNGTGTDWKSMPLMSVKLKAEGVVAVDLGFERAASGVLPVYRVALQIDGSIDRTTERRVAVVLTPTRNLSLFQWAVDLGEGNHTIVPVLVSETVTSIAYRADRAYLRTYQGKKKGG